MSYYSSIIVIILVSLIILCVLVKENARLTADDRKIFYTTYMAIALASVAEWAGVFLNGRMDIPVVATSGPLSGSADNCFPDSC